MAFVAWRQTPKKVNQNFRASWRLSSTLLLYQGLKTDQPGVRVQGTEIGQMLATSYSSCGSNLDSGGSRIGDNPFSHYKCHQGWDNCWRLLSSWNHDVVFFSRNSFSVEWFVDKCRLWACQWWSPTMTSTWSHELVASINCVVALLSISSRMIKASTAVAW